MSVEKLREIMQKLRDPDHGCPWDNKQNFKTIAPYTLEEAYEVVDAIERNAMDELPDELGDLLLQVVYHAQMADEAGLFNFDDVAKLICEKMIRRHPHVFNAEDLASEAEIKGRWEKIKRQERAAKTDEQDDSVLAGLTYALPALKLAQKVQKKVNRVGFDWPNIDGVFEKINEEISEIKAEINVDNNQVAIEDEVGDLLFATVNLARHLRVEPEQALRAATKKFEMRFRLVEQFASEAGESLENLSASELHAYWNKAKQTK